MQEVHQYVNAYVLFALGMGTAILSGSTQEAEYSVAGSGDLFEIGRASCRERV